MEYDPPEHTRLRRLVNRGFTPRVVATYERAISTLAALVLDEALGRGEFDFVGDVARQLPMKMLGRLLGVSDADGDQLVAWGDALIGNTDPEFTTHPGAAWHAAGTQFGAYESVSGTGQAHVWFDV